MFINLKPASERTDKGQAVIARLRPKLARVTGVSLFLNPGAGLAHGRTLQQFHLPVHAEKRQRGDLKTWASNWRTT
jgi:multidrug efflux pump